MSNDEQLDEFITKIRGLLGRGKLEKGIALAEEHFANGPIRVLNDITGYKGQWNDLKTDKLDAVIDDGQEDARKNKILRNFLTYITNPNLLSSPPDVPNPVAATTAPDQEQNAPSKRQLVKVLAKAFRDINDVEAFADDSGVGSENINLSDGSKVAWRELVTQAENKGIWEGLKEILKDELEGNQKAINFIDSYIPEDFL